MSQEKLRVQVQERLQWYLTDLSFRAPEAWPTHEQLLKRLVDDVNGISERIDSDG